MSGKAFQFADFVEEFQVSFIVYDEAVNGYYTDQGKWIDGNNPVDEMIYYKGDFTFGDVNEHPESKGFANATGQTERHMIGIILPLTTDELQKEANGTYTRKDRKIYTLAPLKIGQKIEYKKQRYTIDANKDYEDYADVYMYYAKGVDG
ncbi:TPA: hypothetical protein QC443_002538 [Bacillus cereus]|uniref:hypothetical protein n=1 Tax=Bacillus cereus TaxID=1396 RepID=UPI001928445E|nr:hypothetical protein [Bacillus cereus]MBL3881133.1 hypothetical protein [Bacillus cereus]HDR7980261.1 hypothetical protein [Bacillus cereus]HDR8076489.1 hypothetical protein [Bacillus cereus]HDR8514838.1 hypothetical protein [Bacillus cereus]